MIPDWSLSIKRVADIYTGAMLFNGYHVTLTFDTHLPDYESVNTVMPNIALIDSRMTASPFIHLLDEMTIIYYEGFTIIGEIGCDSNPATIYAEENEQTVTFLGTTLSTLLKRGQPKLDSKVHITVSSIFDTNFSGSEESCSFMILPNDMQILSSVEKEDEFIKNLATFIYSNIIIHILDTFRSFDRQSLEQPTFKQRIYSRKEILSKISDPLGHMSTIVLSKEDKVVPKGNLDYTRKIIAKTKILNTEETEHGNEESRSEAGSE